MSGGVGGRRGCPASYLIFVPVSLLVSAEESAYLTSLMDRPLKDCLDSWNKLTDFAF